MMRKLLVFLLVFLAVLPAVTASDLVDGVPDVRVNDMQVPGNIAAEAGEVVPIDVFFTPNRSATDVEISAWISGERSEGVEESYGDLIAGSREHALLDLRLPDDLDEIDEEMTLYVRIETDEGNWEDSYEIRVKREPYKADAIFVELDRNVRPGDRVPVDVVIKNRGRHELEDLEVAVSVPGLGVSRRTYFGDLEPVDNCTEECDEEDARERRLYLEIPSEAQAGDYEVIVEAYNEDIDSLVRKGMTVTSTSQESNVVVPASNKDVKAGSSVSYELIIVNRGNNIETYEVVPEDVEGLTVSVDKQVLTVPAGSSRTVMVEATAGDEDGAYPFSVSVNSGGQIVDSVSLTANVEEGAIDSSLAILTIVLAIVFIVLLVVLIVLLTRKPESEELEESYY